MPFCTECGASYGTERFCGTCGVALATSAVATTAPSPWEEVKADDGGVYWWNTETDETSWEKPAAVSGPGAGSTKPIDLKTPSDAGPSRPPPRPSKPVGSHSPQPPRPNKPVADQPPARPPLRPVKAEPKPKPYSKPPLMSKPKAPTPTFAVSAPPASEPVAIPRQKPEPPASSPSSAPETRPRSNSSGKPKAAKTVTLWKKKETTNKSSFKAPKIKMVGRPSNRSAAAGGGGSLRPSANERQQSRPRSRSVDGIQSAMASPDFGPSSPAPGQKSPKPRFRFRTKFGSSNSGGSSSPAASQSPSAASPVLTPKAAAPRPTPSPPAPPAPVAATAPSLWEEVKADDGSVYWWNTETDETSWEKPDAVSGPGAGSTKPIARVAEVSKPERKLHSRQSVVRMEEEYIEHGKSEQQARLLKNRERTKDLARATRLDTAVCECSVVGHLQRAERGKSKPIMFYQVDVKFGAGLDRDSVQNLYQNWSVYRRYNQWADLCKTLGRYGLPEASSLCPGKGRKRKFDDRHVTKRFESFKTIMEFCLRPENRQKIAANEHAQAAFFRFIAPVGMEDDKPDGFVLPFELI